MAPGGTPIHSGRGRKTLSVSGAEQTDPSAECKRVLIEVNFLFIRAHAVAGAKITNRVVLTQAGRSCIGRGAATK